MATSKLHTHIECAVEIWKNTVSYDFALYSDIMHDVFKQFHVESKEQIAAFWKIFELTICEDSLVFYYKNVDGVFDIILESQQGYKQHVIDSSEQVLNAFDISNNVYKVISRTYRTLECCKSIFSDDMVIANEQWEEDFYNSIACQGNDNNSRWTDKDLIIQTVLFIKRLSVDLPQAKDLYFHITKSLLNAEYLIMDNYSKLLKDVIELNDVKEEANIVLPWYAYSLVVVAQYLNEMCFRLKKTIFEKSVHRIVIDYHAEEYTANKFSACYMVGKFEMQKFDTYVKSVIDMTLIDHLYEINITNVEKLLLLWRRTENIDNFIRESYHKTINQMVKDKVGNMIRSIVKRSSKGNNQCYFSLGNEHMDDLMQEIDKKTNKFAIETNPYLKIKNDHLNMEIKQSDFDGINMPYKSLSNFEDLNKYDGWILDGWKSYIKNSKLIQEIDKSGKESIYEENMVNNLMEIIDQAMKQNSDYALTSSFYLKAINLFSNVLQQKSELIIDNNGYDNDQDSHHFSLDTFDKLMGLLSTLLANFKRYTSSLYTEICPSFIPPFAHSFYHEKTDEKSKLQKVLVPLSYDVAYDKDKFTNMFFYSSLGVFLLNTDYFYGFIDEHTKMLNGFVLRRTSTINTYVNKRLLIQKTQTEEAVNQMRSDNFHTKNHTIQLLGLFAAFIALISATIGSLRVARSVPEFIIFLLALTFCVVVFSSLISFLGRRLLDNNIASNNGNNEKFHFREWITKSGHWDWFVPAGMALLLLVLLAIMMAVYKIPSYIEEAKETPNTSILLQQHNTSNQEVISNSIIE